MLTEKEMNLLKDLKNEEQVCVEKYNKYSTAASSTKLKSLFQQISQTEQHHLNTINQILNGCVPESNSNSSGSNSNNASSNSRSQNSAQATNLYENTLDKQNDTYLCTDALSTEKYVSSAYNTSIFEFAENNIRDVLAEIQQQEQNHGKLIYDYMAQNGMYN